MSMRNVECGGGRDMARTVDYGLGEYTFPRGWFMIAETAEVTDKPLAVRFFGRDFVLYRGRATGRAVLLDAYCPHMGTHLGINTTSYVVRDGQHVEGDSIRCPYHGWRFGADGQCNEIPGLRGSIPKSTTASAWSSCSRAATIGVFWFRKSGARPTSMRWWRS